MSLERFCRVLRHRMNTLQVSEAEQRELEQQNRRLIDIAVRFLDRKSVKDAISGQRPVTLLLADRKNGQLISLWVREPAHPEHLHRFAAFYTFVRPELGSPTEPVRGFLGRKGLVELGRVIEFTMLVDWNTISQVLAHESYLDQERIGQLRKELRELEARTGPTAIVDRLAADHLYLLPEGATEIWFQRSPVQGSFRRGLARGLIGYGHGHPVTYTRPADAFVAELRRVINALAPEFWSLASLYAAYPEQAENLGLRLGTALTSGVSDTRVPQGAFQALLSKANQLGGQIATTHPQLVAMGCSPTTWAPPFGDVG